MTIPNIMMLSYYYCQINDAFLNSGIVIMNLRHKIIKVTISCVVMGAS